MHPRDELIAQLRKECRFEQAMRAITRTLVAGMIGAFLIGIVSGFAAGIQSRVPADPFAGWGLVR